MTHLYDAIYRGFLDDTKKYRRLCFFGLSFQEFPPGLKWWAEPTALPAL